MKIALVGYGKMGKTIEKIATERGHDVVLKLNETPKHYQLTDNGVDAAIEFTNPEVAYQNIVQLLQSNVPVVSGTTGWDKDLKKVYELVEKYNGSFIHATNFSLGVNLFFEIIKKCMLIMNDYPAYGLSLEEVHHTEKKDSPSGTAISMAENLMEISDYKTWHLTSEEKVKENSIPITAMRKAEVKGTHILQFKSPIDSIELKHEAYSRDGFALGAVMAAEYIFEKNGIFTMKDVLNLK
ncbi:Dihydrodipicolinate reductase [Candidatus Ornithobacterium hominis]|uniref:4-hydroxy-tetrahydrodipicolinate reductase n=1 Tax=Candidatus Ornithobacterium hominis TaxID=2497989 RepID=A0A383TVU6_9FLAO|nr:4-hydroxy-tetrahydrodipicolinate reductase [Candidatus Ornithobacterium hominis]MCT7904560.1 4-hydroxy-tetrahydrodipicolinate reductase [Candidatus Ornithobacterium hominis]SZD71457.1 Dihydrodipicolinate reductase [Candidatus Ornithobacterium hominis]